MGGQTMNASPEVSSPTLLRDIGSAMRQIVGGTLRTVRFLVFSVLALLEPVIVFVLAAVVLIVSVTSGFYWLLNWLHPTHFPFGAALRLIGECALAATVYCTIVHLLEQRS
jgi:hypothetical protein